MSSNFKILEYMVVVFWMSIQSYLSIVIIIIYEHKVHLNSLSTVFRILFKSNIYLILWICGYMKYLN